MIINGSGAELPDRDEEERRPVGVCAVCKEDILEGDECYYFPAISPFCRVCANCVSEAWEEATARDERY